MHRNFLDILADPIDLYPLRLEINERRDDEILEGFLKARNGTGYAVRRGIPRFVLTQDEAQLQTSKAFGFKWGKLDTYDSPAAKANATSWMLDKYGFESLRAWVSHFGSKDCVLDLGCGSGFSSSLWLNCKEWTSNTTWVGVDISSAIDVAQDRLGHIPNTLFIQADALQLPFPDASFDGIFSEGVLHHTPSTRRAILSASRVLKAGGEFDFYVYRRKGPVREFTDDYIRQGISSMSDEDAWETMRSLTSLARELAQLRTRIRLQHDVPLLGIEAGDHDVHRLIYWNLAKLYWNDTLSFEENVHVNFDWYRPKYAHRQTAEQVKEWCNEAQLTISRFHEQNSGFSVRALKPR